MSKEDELHPTLHGALHLDGSSHSVKQFYADWAKQYDEDCANWDYSASDNVLKILNSLTPSEQLTLDPADKQINLIDAGCGTGLLAQVLHAAGYSNLHGFDLSQEMVDLASKLNIYQSLTGNININNPVPEDWKGQFDCTVSIGVFTPGHVGPDALSQLIDMTRKGGLVMVSTRVAYYESENYQKHSDQLETAGRIKLIDARKNWSYTSDSAAHYWSYAVL